MTVEEVMDYDSFPVGMRVLAVDDDTVCLKLLEGLLRKCQYNVTTTNQAREALRMLRENRDRFDLVISDVHMPDMDGFKLLEHLGLEMDLPVIMLSVNSDPKLVMKGVTHGACDYLVKPVRIEELQNIWQHVVRKKKVNPKVQSKSGYFDKAIQVSGEGGGVPCQTGSGDQSGKLNKKRKDDEDDGSDNGDEEEPGTQKKPRVVWSIELHRKFVNAVHQLGIEKAVPKRILDLMNVDGLTRENVASHLQKYRLYLKRISSSEAQQANMVAALGGKEAAYMRMSALDGLGEFRSLTGSGRLAGPTFSPYSQSGMLGRLNSPGGINLGNLTSSTLVRPSQNVSNPTNMMGNLHRGVSPASQNTTLYQGVPSSLDFDQLQQNKGASRVGDFTSLDDSRIFGAAASFSDNRAVNTNNMLTGASNNSMLLQGNSPQALNGGVFVDHSNVSLSSFHSDPFEKNAVHQLSQFHLNGLPPTDSFSQGQMPLTNGRDNHSLRPQLHSRLPSFSSTASSGGLEDSRGEIQCPEVFVTGGSIQNMNQVAGQCWGDPKQNFSQNNMFSNFNFQAAPNGIASPLSQGVGQNGITDGRIDVRSSLGAPPTFMQQGEVEKTNSRAGAGEEFILDQIKPQPGFPPNSYDAFDDLMSSMIKREQDGSMFEGDMAGFDGYQFGSCN